MANTKSVADQMQDPEPIVVPGSSDAPEVAPSAAVQTQATIAQQSMLNVMREVFSKQKRVRVKVRNDGPVPVQVNGYTFLIRENVPVEVPEQVAEILEDAGYI